MDAGLDLLVIGKDLRHSIDKKNLVVSLRTSKFYKLIWQGFPLLVFGTTDKVRFFHIFEVAVCGNEQTEDSF
jgi:hypothetical protein